jgi:hypothetical protein
MSEILQWAGRGVVLALIGLLIGIFADTPSYTAFPPDQALLRLSFSHGGGRPECRRRTAEELAELSPQMRAPMECPRGRLGLLVELELDGDLFYRETIPPSGIAGDGPSQVYKGFAVAPGHYELVVRLRDSDRDTGFDYERRAEITLEPRQNFVVDFRADAGGFFFR